MIEGPGTVLQYTSEIDALRRQPLTLKEGQKIVATSGFLQVYCAIAEAWRRRDQHRPDLDENTPSA